ncbi:DUF134 domain-containing protein, partial [candidate division WOR-3 bacterium]|nr:DUF134 domain-containing protein [candidate division WOR-3 bacterium]
MPRPPNCRRIAGKPGACVFKPAGVPACRLKWLNLTLDEFEALRLADLDGLHQEQAANRMKVSRQTFGRTVENARRKVAQALSSGMALNIETKLGTVTYFNGTNIGMFRRAAPEQKAAAWTFIKWFIAPEQQVEWSLGAW